MPENVSGALSNREMESIGLRRDAVDRYRIPIPEYANIAADTVAKHAAGPRSGHLALIFEAEDGTLRHWTFAELDRAASAFARGLSRLGVHKGDPVGVHTGQRPETAIAHLAIYKLGAIVVTLSQLYGPETLRHILGDCALRAIVTEPAAVDGWKALRCSGRAMTHPPLRRIMRRNGAQPSALRADQEGEETKNEEEPEKP